MPETQVMAVLNCTPDSFSDGGRLVRRDDLLRAAETALTCGVHVLDIGGESTRPGAPPVPLAEELRRVLPAVKAIREAFPEAVLSIDTRKAAVAEATLEAGASIINDVSGLQFDPAMARTVARFDARLVLMHSQGTPETMQQDPTYQEVVEDLIAFFRTQIQLAQAAGISANRLILDPGFGFGKTLSHNLAILKHFNRFTTLGLPLLAGTSRKSFLTAGSGTPPVSEREPLTAATTFWAIAHGAAWVRIHDPVVQMPVVRLADQLKLTS
jgi:dihydropteroate synthase